MLTTATTIQRTSRARGVSLLAMSMAALLPATALAQSAVQPSPSAPPSTVAGTTEPGADDVGQIVVTGSRIAREGFTAPTPVTTVGEQLIAQQAAVRVTDVLVTIPSLRQTTSPAGVSQQQGGNFLALRGLGAVRTLVLVDNKRFVATTVNNQVDANLIPTALVDRIEVVTGGASAAWGSDAVAGVVNFILKKDLEGVQGSAQYGQSTHGDAKEYAFSLAGGTSFGGGRGHIAVAGEYSRSYDYVFQRDREWASQDTAFVNGATPTGDRYIASGVRNILTAGGTIIASPGGGILPATSPLRGIQFGTGGTVQPFVYGTNGAGGPLASNASLQVGGDGIFVAKDQPLTSPLTRYTLYSIGSYDLTDTIKLTFEGSYSRSKTSTNFLDIFSPNAGVGLTIQRGNPYIPASIAAIMASNNIASINLGRVNYELGRTIGTGDNKVFRFASGLEGEFGKGWTWEVHGAYGQTDNKSKLVNNLINANWRAAQDVVVGPGGTPICRINSTAASDIAITTNPGYGGFGATAGCQPVNPFGPNSISAAAADYVTGTQEFDFKIGQLTAGASVKGEPFSTWAGPVSLVAGGEFRRETLHGDSDAISKLSTIASRSGGFNFGNPKPIDGRYDARELFGEIVVPLIHSDAIKALDFNGAVRYTNYTTSGGVTTWKAGLTFEPVDGALFRATRSRDIRAPNLNELFLSTQVFVAGVIDYGRPGNPQSNGLRLAQGNPNLEPERADTTSVGLSLRPAFFPGFRASLDWYDIKVKGAIGSLGAQDIINFCFGQGGLQQNTSYCSQITRNPDGSFATVIATNFNLQSLKTNGLDLELAYNHDLGAGKLGLRFLGNYLNAFKINSGTVTIDRAGEASQNGFGSLPQGSPKWRSTLTASYTIGAVNVFGQWRYIGKGVYDVLGQSTTTGTATYINDNRIPAVSYFDMAVAYKIPSSPVELFVKGDNILDKDPPIVLQGTNVNPIANSGSFYDLVGRRITGGVRVKF